jgi:hypothetical protein
LKLNEIACLKDDSVNNAGLMKELRGLNLSFLWKRLHETPRSRGVKLKNFVDHRTSLILLMIFTAASRRKPDDVLTIADCFCAAPIFEMVGNAVYAKAKEVHKPISCARNFLLNKKLKSAVVAWRIHTHALVSCIPPDMKMHTYTVRSAAKLANVLADYRVNRFVIRLPSPLCRTFHAHRVLLRR